MNIIFLLYNTQKEEYNQVTKTSQELVSYLQNNIIHFKFTCTQCLVIGNLIRIN